MGPGRGLREWRHSERNVELWDPPGGFPPLPVRVGQGLERSCRAGECAGSVRWREEEYVSEKSAAAIEVRQGDAGGLDPALVERLRRILRQVQGVWPEQLDEPLPDLADRSITMLNLIVAIDDDLRVDVPLEVVFTVKTLRDLAEAVAAQPSYRGVRW